MGANQTYSQKKENAKQKLYAIKIKDIVIHSVPLPTNKTGNFISSVGNFFKKITSLSPTLTHIAIQLNMENNTYIIIEFGQYFPEKNDEKPNFLYTNPFDFTPKEEFFFINKDGARFFNVNKNNYKKYLKEDSFEYVISLIIASQQYGLTIDEIKNQKLDENKDKFYHCICDIKNKMSLGELCENFKNEKWEAKGYSLTLHNCQTFGDEVIKILNACRKDKNNKTDKKILPHSIISTLNSNEKK